MKLKPWSCLTAAFAAAISIPEQKLFSLIGHTGGEIVNPRGDGMSRYRGFHVQEIAYALRELGYYIQEWQAKPVMQTGDVLIKVNVPNIRRRIKTGVITGQRVDARWHHALYAKNKKIFDPDTGEETSLKDFKILCFYEVGKCG